MIKNGPFGKETMTVSELISELQKIPNPDTTAITSEGCDCDGVIVEVTMETYIDQPFAYLRREKSDGL